MDKKLQFPADFNFKCTGCGRCCKDWTIHVDRNTYEKISGSDFYLQLKKELGQGELFVEDREDKTLSTIRREDGSCVFLDKEGLCIIHREKGYDWKPLGCRQYPFKLRPTPEGIFAGVSFYCDSCRENSGVPLAEYARDIELWLHEHNYRAIEDKGILLDDTIVIDWAGYRVLEDFVTLCLDSHEDMEEALWNALARVCLVVLMARKEARREITSSQVESLLARALKLPLQRDDIFRQLTLFYTLTVVGVLESSSPEEAREVTEAALQGRIIKSGSLGKDVDMVNFGPYFMGNPSPWKIPHLKRFLSHLLFRKFLVGEDQVLYKLAALMTALGLVEFYLYLAPYERGAESPELEDLYFAYSIVEKGFSAHSRIMVPFFRIFAEGWVEQLQMLEKK